MTNIKPYEVKISCLVRDGHHHEALSFFKQNVIPVFPYDVISSCELITSRIIQACRKAGLFSAAILFFSDYLNLSPQLCHDKRLLQEFGWALFFKLKDLKTVSNDASDRSLEYPEVKSHIIDFLQNYRLSDNTVLWTNLLFRFAKAELGANNPDLQTIYKILAQHQPEDFSDEPVQINNAEQDTQKISELASDKEKFLALKSKICLETGKYDECINLNKSAMQGIKNMHHGNHIWFVRRSALAFERKGELREAQKKMEQVLKKKNDWFIKHEMAGIHYKQGNYSEALKMGAEAALAPGRPAYKINLFELMADICRKSGLHDMYKTHFLYLWIIRKENHWKISPALDEIVNTFGPDEKKMTRKQAFCKLHEFWEQQACASIQTKTYEGIIIKILHPGHGGDGFIKDEHGKTYYFKAREIQNPKKSITEGLGVSFQKKKVTHKGKKTDNAVAIYVL